jgi:hypothetical protein
VGCRDSPRRLCAELTVGSPEELFKMASLQLLALTYSGAFPRIEESVFSILLGSQLERVEPAHQRPELVDYAVSPFKEEAFSLFRCFLHLVSVGFLALNFHCEGFNSLQDGLGDCLSFFPQEQNVSRSILRVSAAECAPRALEAHVSWVVENLLCPRHHMFTTEGLCTSSLRVPLSVVQSTAFH